MSGNQATLRALGVTRTQRVPRSADLRCCSSRAEVRSSPCSALWARPPPFPIGVARRADPDVGVHADWLVLTLGVVALTAIVATIGFLAALRARTRTIIVRIAPKAPGRRSVIVELAARARLRPSVSNGLRMAFQPGRGDTAVPVRSACLGAVLGVLGVTVVLVFTSSLNHLVETPRLYGWTWDFKLADANASSGCGRDDYGLSRNTGSRGGHRSLSTGNMQVDGRPVTGWGLHGPTRH